MEKGNEKGCIRIENQLERLDQYRTGKKDERKKMKNY